MKKTLAWVIIAFALSSCKDDAKTETANATTTETTKPADRDYQLGDNKYVELCKTAGAALERGDIDSWITIFADNAVYHWNNYDSLSGKAAIADYWRKRWAETLDSMTIKKPIWISIKVDKPLTEGQPTGNYALSWNVVTAKYKTGKSMTQRIHTAYHFNADDKIDRVSQYLDRVPITAAMKP